MRGSTWVAVSYGGRQVVSFASMLVLVRFVDPKAFGLVALAFTALFVLQTLQDSGMGSALIHRREDLEEAAATVLIFSAVTGAALYAVAFFAAPYASTIFHVHGLTNVLRVLAILLPIRSFSTVPSALLERAVEFRPRTISDLAAAASSAGISVTLAVLGAGVWALVVGQVAGSAVSTLALWILAPTRPDPRRASRRIARELLRYGRYITGGNLLMIASTSMDNVVVARLLGATLLGFYSVAFRLTELPVLVIGSIVGRVMFPIYSMMRDDVATVRRAYVQNLQRVALLSLPISVGMAAGARPLVRVLLGDRWLPSVAALQVLAIYAVVRALLGPAGELYKGMGKPQYNVVTGMIYFPIALPLLWILVEAKGTLGAGLAVLIATSLTGFVTMTLVFRLLDLRPGELFRALAPFLLSSALVAGAIELTVSVTDGLPPAASLAAVIVVGAVAFVVGTALFARPIVAQMWSSLKLSRGPEELPIEPAPV
jgi:PST family polysaccharide transporter